MSEVIALFESRAHARGAWEDLGELGFRRDSVGMMECSHESWGAGSDRGTGGFARGTAVLTAETVAVVPGVGRVIATGALASAAADLEAGVAPDGVLGAIAGSGDGSREETAAYYRECLKHGGVVVTVDETGKRLEDAKRIMSVNGAIILDEYDGGWRG